MSTRVLIVGSGALATLFAARLAAVDVDVTILGTWPEGLAALRSGGARLDGAGSFHVRVTDNPAECLGTKTAMVLVKTWQTQRAGQQLAGCLAGEGVAVTFQNGLGNDDILSGILGRRRVFRGVTTLGAGLLEPGYVRLNGEGVVILEKNPRLTPLETILRVAKFELSVVEDILPTVWTKLMINAAINPLTALLRIKNGKLLTIPSVHNLMGEIARETATVAESLGISIPTSSFKDVDGVAKKTSENISSMLQDVLRGAPTEVDAINGAIVRKGEERKVATPVNKVIWSLVKALNPA